MGRTTDSTLRWSGVSDYVSYSSTSVQSAEVPANTYEVRLVATTACHINIAKDPTAAATDNNGFALPAGVVEYFHVSPGEKVAVIRSADDGVLCVAFMTR